MNVDATLLCGLLLPHLTNDVKTVCALSSTCRDARAAVLRSAAWDDATRRAAIFLARQYDVCRGGLCDPDDALAVHGPDVRVLGILDAEKYAAEMCLRRLLRIVTPPRVRSVYAYSDTRACAHMLTALPNATWHVAPGLLCGYREDMLRRWRVSGSTAWSATMAREVRVEPADGLSMDRVYMHGSSAWDGAPWRVVGLPGSSLRDIVDDGEPGKLRWVPRACVWLGDTHLSARPGYASLAPLLSVASLLRGGRGPTFVW